MEISSRVLDLRKFVQHRLFTSAAEQHVGVVAVRFASAWLSGHRECPGFHVIVSNGGLVCAHSDGGIPCLVVEVAYAL